MANGYNYNVINNYWFNSTTGDIIDPFSAGSGTSFIVIINDSIILSSIDDFSAVSFYDINDNWLGYLQANNMDWANEFNIGTVTQNDISNLIPPNAYRFKVFAYHGGDGGTSIPYVDPVDFQNVLISYATPIGIYKNIAGINNIYYGETLVPRVYKGRPSYYLSFDGVDDYVDITNTLSGNAKEIEITFKSDIEITSSILGKILIGGTSLSDVSIFIGDVTGNFATETVGIQTSGDSVFFEAGTFNSGTQYTLRFVWNGSEYDLYVNNNLVNRLNTVGNIANINDIALLGKRSNSTAYFEGDILYFKVIDENDNTAIEYDFSDGSGTTLGDSVGNNDGTIVGATWNILYDNIIYGEAPIITNGLSLYLDASNPNSYPGTGTTWFDLSGNNYDLTLNGTVNYSSSFNGNLDFNGGYATRNMSGTFISNPSLVSAHTVSFWCKVRTSGSYYIYSTGGQTGSTGDAFSYQNGSPFFNTRTSTQDWNGGFDASTWFPLNEWFLWTAVRSGNNLTLYRNTEQVFSRTSSSNSISDAQTLLAIGRPNNRLDILGAIMDFPFLTIYNRALSLNEIKQNFNATKERFKVLPNTDSIKFLGSSDYALGSDISAYDWINGLTFECEIYKTSYAGTGIDGDAIVSKSSSNNREFHFRLNGSNVNTWISIAGSGADYTAFSSSNAYPLNEWFTFKVIYDNSTLKAYINNIQVSTQSTNGQPIYNGPSDIAIGTWAESVTHYGLDGKIRNIRLWNDSTKNNLVGEWLCNNGSGSVINDTSGNNNDLTLYGDYNWVQE